MKIERTGDIPRAVQKKSIKEEKKKIITKNVSGIPNTKRIFSPDINRAELNEWMARTIGIYEAKDMLRNFEKLEIIIRCGYNEHCFGSLTYMADWMLQNAWDDVIEAFQKNDSDKMQYAYEDWTEDLSVYILRAETILKRDYGFSSKEKIDIDWRLI